MKFCKHEVISAIFDVTPIIPEIKDIFWTRTHAYTIDIASRLFFSETFCSFVSYYSIIKISQNSIHQLIFSNIMIELT